MAYEDCLKGLKLSALSYGHLRGDMIQTYNIITGVYDRDIRTGLFNLKIDSSTRDPCYEIFKEIARLEVNKNINFSFE